MEHKKSLLDILKFKKENKDDIEIECPLANPLSLRFDSLLNIKSVDFYDCDFKLDSIEEYKRCANSTSFVFSDYHLRDRNGVYQNALKLRVVDEDVLILKNYESMPYDEELDEILKDTGRTGKFEIHEDDITTTFCRVNNLKEQWNAEVKKLIDADGNGKITRTDPVTTTNVRYWDFWREEEKNATGSEMLFIEIDEKTGWIKMWRGDFINSENILVI